ncbi:hypothetical protein [Tritonibacter mobilis]|uniref:hypothetical protein n=1 Tax=Tritonibacter mobilis TaxID=379347 RepID=UPI0024BBB64A|nr:hypothetical protein [Tritonibacter mobilis]WHQ84912.1 hypothetical protein OMR53_16910 [Tritonibacter mobilis]
MRRLTFTHGLGLAVITLAVLALVFWVPQDTVSGYLVSKRGRVSIGDAMAPGVSLGLMALSGGLILLEARKREADIHPNGRSLGFLLVILVICLMAFGAMIWTGPLAVALFRVDDSYRNLRDTAPWKYLGFILGGVGLVAALISLVEHRVTLRAALLGVAGVGALIGVFDLAFDDLLLPPNGDQ